MNDKSNKLILIGILICLIIIALKPNNINSGMRGTILIFDYDSNTKNFNLKGSMNYADYFSNPNKYGLPTN